jgi:hypothetical protein
MIAYGKVPVTYRRLRPGIADLTWLLWLALEWAQFHAGGLGAPIWRMCGR